MSKPRARRAGAAADGRRRHRRRLIPKWLKDPARLDAVAHSRCMMVLSVLSGETPVTQAIAQARISRGTYYQLETRAVKAMLTALNPVASAQRGTTPDLSSTRIQALLERVRVLEQDKRRMKRLLLLSRKARQPQALTERLARRRTRARLGLTRNGSGRSRASIEKAVNVTPASTPTKTGGGAS
jgi:hypothetical protein